MQLLCLGDVAFADKHLAPRVWAPPGDFSPGRDARIIFNWEFPIGDTLNTKPRASGIRFLTYPDSASIVRKWAPGIATMATNHILDAGEVGLAQTINLLHQTGFNTVGAGMTADEIERPLFWETEEGKLAIINWVFAETHPDWMSIPGPNCWPGKHEANAIIQNVKHNADWILLFLHWSDEHFSYPRPEDRILASELVQMGANIIIGHHPHVVRGMEVIDSCPVFYSLGNYYFADIPDSMGGWTSRGVPRNHEGLGLQIDFRRGKAPEIYPIPFWNTGNQVVVDTYRRAYRRLNSVSRPLYKFQDEEYSRWYLSKRAKFDQWEARWHFGVLRLGIKGTMRRLLQKTSSYLQAHH